LANFHAASIGCVFVIISIQDGAQLGFDLSLLSFWIGGGWFGRRIPLGVRRGREQLLEESGFFRTEMI